MITNEIYFFKNQSSVSISDSLYNVNDGVLILQVDGNASNLELSVLGNTDLIDDDFIALKTINATDYSMSDKITSTGIYWIDINGIRKVKLNLSKITGSVNVKALTKRGLTTDLVARAMAANSQSGGCSLEEVKAITGELSDLSTEDKTNLVNAINEVANSNDGKLLTLNMSITAGNNIYSGEPIEKCSELINNLYKIGEKNVCILFYNQIYTNTYRKNCLMSLYQDASQQNTLYEFTGLVNGTGDGYTTIVHGMKLIIAGTWDNNIFTANRVILINDNETISMYNINNKFLSKTNTTAFTPTSDYNPATKKYVDDAIASAITTTLEGSY